ncbi:hypothetical protein OUZ56_008953 [Daphnia magna]|uniref:Uncharacterized protein n=1 Tax=Daphnia magna TaxID=35525 RepID=A0ABR0AEY1_9CRUS|nr:hypothetical protein OUZ56_008953 [Daphnia magna]
MPEAVGSSELDIRLDPSWLEAHTERGDRSPPKYPFPIRLTPSPLMARGLDFAGPKLTLHQLNFQPGLPQGGQQLPHSHQVFLRISRVDDDVIQVNEANRPSQTGLNQIHHALERPRCGALPEGHNQKLIKPVGGDKRRLDLILFV